MPQHAYRRSPDKIDMAAEDRAIRRDTILATAATLIAFAAALWIGPWFMELPTALSERLAFAALWWALPGFNLLVAIMMVSIARRRSPEDIGGQAAGPPSDSLAIKAAFLQNTLEQCVLAGGFYFALAAVTGGAWLAILPVSAAFFVIGRTLFYIGYHRGARGRSLGMGLTMMPAALGYPTVLGLAVFAG